MTTQQELAQINADIDNYEKNASTMEAEIFKINDEMEL